MKFFEKNRKRIIVIAIIVILAAIAALIILNQLSMRRVMFDLPSGVETMEIYKADSANKIAAVHDSEFLNLSDGNYYALATSDEFEKNQHFFLITDQSEIIKLNPSLTKEQRDAKLVSDKEYLRSLVATKFPSQSMTVADGQIAGDGTWYITTMSALAGPRDYDYAPDTYRVILHHENGAWGVAVSPRLVIRYSDFNDIPQEIIEAANRLEPPKQNYF